MTSNEFMTSEALKALKRRAQDERAKYLAGMARAMVQTMKVLLSGAAPGGLRAAQ